MKPGDRLHDNDPRMKPRVLTIVPGGLTTDRGLQRVRAESYTGRVFFIAVGRIHTDGKPRRSGFDLEVV